MLDVKFIVYIDEVAAALGSLFCRSIAPSIKFLVNFVNFGNFTNSVIYNWSPKCINCFLSCWGCEGNFLVGICGIYLVIREFMDWILANVSFSWKFMASESNISFRKGLVSQLLCGSRRAYSVVFGDKRYKNIDSKPYLVLGYFIPN